MSQRNHKFQPSISREELAAMPLTSFDGTIHIVKTHNELKRIISVLNAEEILGFDTETKPSFKKGKVNRVALVQLSTRFHSYLIRTNHIGLPDEIIELFENRKIMKIGAALRDDLSDLKKIREFRAHGFLDLQKYVEAFGIENKGLSKLSGIILGRRISKSQQLSNWEADDLTEAQQSYAATDAWIPYLIYKELISNRDYYEGSR